MMGGPAALVLVRRKPPATPASGGDWRSRRRSVKPRARASVPLRTATGDQDLEHPCVDGEEHEEAEGHSDERGGEEGRPPYARRCARRRRQTMAAAASMARMLTMTTVSSGVEEENEKGGEDEGESETGQRSGGARRSRRGRR